MRMAHSSSLLYDPSVAITHSPVPVMPSNSKAANDITTRTKERSGGAAEWCFAGFVIEPIERNSFHTSRWDK